MNIQTFANLTKISAHTIRYYEKIGLLKHVSRNASGHRYFTEADIVWLEFVKRLKNTGMPLQNIRKYAELRDKGVSTSVLRMQILEEHAVMLEEKIAVETQHLQKLQEKIAHYSKVIETDFKA